MPICSFVQSTFAPVPYGVTFFSLILINFSTATQIIATPSLEYAIVQGINSRILNLGFPEQYSGSIKEGDVLDAKSIANWYKAGNAVSSGQLCISLGKFDSANWSVLQEGQSYSSNINQAYKIKVLCDRGVELSESINDWQDQELVDGSASCQNLNIQSSERYCLVVLTEQIAYSTPYRPSTSNPSTGILGFILPIAIMAFATLVYSFMMNLFMLFEWHNILLEVWPGYAVPLFI